MDPPTDRKANLWLTEAVYVKDYRTNLCFMSYHNVNGERYIFTSVPCTPEVEQEIVKVSK